jgi:hypothetical protein
MERTSNFLAYWDCLGFEFVVNTTKMEHQDLMADLTGTPKSRSNILYTSLMRAKFNPQRNPQIWGFTSTLTEDELVKISKESPQELANLIKELGWKHYGETPQKKVIE